MILTKEISFALAMGVCVSGVASAQQYQLRAGAGVVGYDDSTKTFVVTSGQNFQLELWLVNNGTARTVDQAFAMIAYAHKASGSGTSAVPGASPISIGTNGVAWDSAWAYMNGLTVSSLREASTNIGVGTEAGNHGSNPLPYGLYMGKSRNVNQAGLAVGANAQMRVAILTLSNTLAEGTIWGDSAEEAGVFVANSRTGNYSPSLGSSGILASDPAGDSWTFGSSRYRVSTVPEPATMAALGLGLVALARKRRTKK